MSTSAMALAISYPAVALYDPRGHIIIRHLRGVLEDVHLVYGGRRAGVSCSWRLLVASTKHESTTADYEHGFLALCSSASSWNHIHDKVSCRPSTMIPNITLFPSAKKPCIGLARRQDGHTSRYAVSTRVTARAEVFLALGFQDRRELSVSCLTL